VRLLQRTVQRLVLQPEALQLRVGAQLLQHILKVSLEDLELALVEAEVLEAALVVRLRCAHEKKADG
jgi:hypothetical protein